MKQTAVEWFFEQLTEVDYACINKTFLQNNNSLAGYMLRELLERAKAMEKEQIIDAFNYAQIDLGMEADEYYEQIFKPYCMPEGLDTPEKHEQYLKDIGLINK